MKRVSLTLAFACLMLVTVLVVKRAGAADPTPPGKLDLATAVRLDRDMAHLREAETAIARIRESVRTYDDDALAILTAAKIDPQAFAKGDVHVDYATGQITRAAPKVATK